MEFSFGSIGLCILARIFDVPAFAFSYRDLFDDFS